jgi:hypothetical protein
MRLWQDWWTIRMWWNHNDDIFVVKCCKQQKNQEKCLFTTLWIQHSLLCLIEHNKNTFLLNQIEITRQHW